MPHHREKSRLKSLMAVESHGMRAAILNELFEIFSARELFGFLSILESRMSQQDVHSRKILHSLFVNWLETAPKWQERIAELPRSLLVAHPVSHFGQAKDLSCAYRVTQMMISHVAEPGSRQWPGARRAFLPG